MRTLANMKLANDGSDSDSARDANMSCVAAK